MAEFLSVVPFPILCAQFKCNPRSQDSKCFAPRRAFRSATASRVWCFQWELSGYKEGRSPDRIPPLLWKSLHLKLKGDCSSIACSSDSVAPASEQDDGCLKCHPMPSNGLLTAPCLTLTWMFTWRSRWFPPPCSNQMQSTFSFGILLRQLDKMLTSVPPPACQLSRANFSRSTRTLRELANGSTGTLMKLALKFVVISCCFVINVTLTLTWK